MEIVEMKMWPKIALSGFAGLAVLVGGVVVVQRQALSSGRRELQQHGASGFEKAQSSLKLADRLGSAEAAFEIGKCYEDGVVVPVNHEWALTWFRKAEGRNHPEAMAIVGQAMLDGDNSAKDPAKGAELLRRSAEAGSPLGMFKFSRALTTGKGVPENPQLGTSWADRAAEAGQVDAAFTQGTVYLLTGKDTQKGIHFLEIAAAKGSHPATMALFDAYSGNIGSTPDPVKALALLQKKVQDGNEWAMFKLGVAHARGQFGLKEDQKEGERLIRLAASKGDLDARKIVAAMDAPKPDPITLIGPQVVVSDGGYARVIGYAKNISNATLDANVQFDLIDPRGVTLENYSKTLFGIPPGGSQMIDIAIAPYHRNARVQVRGVKWR
jgi:TPR repeat protein